MSTRWVMIEQDKIDEILTVLRQHSEKLMDLERGTDLIDLRVGNLWLNLVDPDRPKKKENAKA